MEAKTKSSKGRSRGKCSTTQAASCQLILEDLLIRLDNEATTRATEAKTLADTLAASHTKLDTRLDAIESEIAGVKKVVRFITWVVQVAPFVVGIAMAFHKYLHLDAIWNLIPKGRGNRATADIRKK